MFASQLRDDRDETLKLRVAIFAGLTLKLDIPMRHASRTQADPSNVGGSHSTNCRSISPDLQRYSAFVAAASKARLLRPGVPGLPCRKGGSQQRTHRQAMPTMLAGAVRVCSPGEEPFASKFTVKAC